jgi:hypothetical protein
MTSSKEFDRPITDADCAARLAEVVAEVTARHGRAPLYAATSIVGNKIRCTLDFTSPANY